MRERRSKKYPSGGTVFRGRNGFRRAWMGENAEKRIAAFFACAVFGRQRVRQIAVVFFRPGMVSHGTWPLPDGRAIFVRQVFFCPALPGRVSMKAVTMAMESVMQMYRQSVFAAVAIPGTSRGLPESFGPDPSRARVRCMQPLPATAAVRESGGVWDVSVASGGARAEDGTEKVFDTGAGQGNVAPEGE